jgi:hypothetical protein
VADSRTFRVTLAESLRNFAIDKESWEEQAQYRKTWKETVTEAGSEFFMTQWLAKRKTKRENKSQATETRLMTEEDNRESEHKRWATEVRQMTAEDARWKVHMLEIKRRAVESRQMEAEDVRMTGGEKVEAMDAMLLSSSSSPAELQALTNRLRRNLLSNQQKRQVERLAAFVCLTEVYFTQK